MAVSAITGLITAGSGLIAAGSLSALTFLGLSGGAAFGAMFALGAGLGAITKALAPKPDLGNLMRGITATVREPAGSRKVIYGRTRVGGGVVFIHHSGSDNEFLHLVIVFATHEIESYDEIWFNDKKIWDGGSFEGDWGTYVTIDATKKGTATQTASTALVNDVNAWTSNHKLSGIAYLTFKLKWDRDKFPQGVPNITAVIKGKKVYDPRLDSTAGGSGSHRANDSSTWEYSSNPALCVRDYLTDSEYGLGEAASNIDIDALTDAADHCDGTGDYSTATQKRFECHGRIDTANQIKSNIEQLLSSMGGKITYSGGKYFIDSAEYRAPTVTIDETHVISAIKTQTKQSRRSGYNGVKGTFISEEKNYKILDYPAQISSTYATEDGDPVYLDMPLPFVTNNLQAQRLAKIALLKSRQQTVISMTVNLAGLKIKVGDVINITNDKLNYSAKKFEVIGYQLAVKNDGVIGVQLECIETASAIYDWTSSDEEDFLSGGELDLYDGRTVDNVTSLSSTEIGLRGPDGGVLSAVELTWTAPDDAFIDFYTVRYNKNGTTDYLERQTREPRVLLEGLDITSNYDFRVKAQNLIGVQSSGTSLTNVALNGDTSAPSAPTGGAATGGIQTITAEWSNPSDIDFKHVEVFVNTTNSIPASPTAVVDGEEYVVTGLSGAVTRYFWLKSVDFSGNKSAATASFNGTSVVASNSDIGTGAVDTDEIQDDAVTIDKIANTLESTNYVAGTSGWRLTTAGDFEAGDGTFRGNITATSITLEGTSIAESQLAQGVQDSLALADSASQVNKGLALLINQTANGSSNSGECGLVGVDKNGNPEVSTNGFIMYNGTKYTVDRHQYSTNHTILTNLANKKGFICIDVNNTKPFDTTNYGNLDIAFVYKVGDQWYYDENSTSEIQFTPSSMTGNQTGTDNTTTPILLAIGYLETGNADVITAGGLFEPVELESAPFYGDTYNSGTIGGISIDGSKLYAGTGTWANSNTGFYLDNTGKFSLKDKLFFSPTDSRLTVSGNITADTITVNDQLVVLGPLEAKSLAPGTITREMLSQDVLDEIFGALATSVGGSNGDYKEGTGNFTTSGGTVTLGTSSDKFDHGTADVDVEFIVDHFFYSTTNYTTAQAQATLNFEVSADGTFTDLTSATKTHTLQFNEYDLSGYYGYTYLVYYLTGDVTKTFTSGSGNDIPDDTDLQFRVRVTGVGTAFTSQTVPFTLEANEGVTGVVSTGGNADTLDNLDSTKFLRSDEDDTFDANLTITGNLTVQGTQTSLEVATLQVEDKNVVLNYGAGDTSASANGAGITIQDAVDASTDASITWDATNDEFDFSNQIHVTGKISSSFGSGLGGRTTYGGFAQFSADSQIDIVSTSSGDWGSAINFAEGTASGNTDVWSIARKTTGGSGDSSLHFNFGTTNAHNNTNRFNISSSGDGTFSGAVGGNTLEIGGTTTIDASRRLLATGAADLLDGTTPAVSGSIAYFPTKMVSPKFVFLNDAQGDDNYIVTNDNNNTYTVNGNESGVWVEFYGDKTLSHAGLVYDWWKGKGAELKQFTNTTGTAGTTFLTLHNTVGTSDSDGDLSQQQTFIDFVFTDANSNEYPQVRIGAQVGPDADANTTVLEGQGAFVVYTNNATGNTAGTTTGLNESFRVSYDGDATIAGSLSVAGVTSTTSMNIDSAGHGYFTIDSGGVYETGIIYRRNGTSKWETFISSSSDDYRFYSYGGTATQLTIRDGVNGNGGTLFSGLKVTDGSGWYGNYGAVLLNSNQNYTSSSRGWMMTNAYEVNKFALLYSNSATTLPALTTAGAAASGTSVALEIDNTGAVSVGGSFTMSSTGSATLTIAADTDNATSEDENPTLVMTQDGGIYYSHVGINGNADNKFTGATANYSYIYSSLGFQIATDAFNTAKLSLTIEPNGTTTLHNGTLKLVETANIASQITFVDTDAAENFAIKLNGESLDFYEPEDTNKLHMRIVDDGGVNAPFGFNTGADNGIQRISAAGDLVNIGYLEADDYIQLGLGTASRQNTDYVYIGGSGLDGADAAIYLGNHGGGSGYGWRLYYHGSGSGNLNDLSIQSENLGSPVNVLRFNQDGVATFANYINAEQITFDSTSSSGTGGGRIWDVKYTGDDHLAVASIDKSSGSLIIGYGAEGGTNTANTFTSTFDNFSGKRSAVQFRNDSVQFWGTSANVQTAVGSELTTMAQRIVLHTDNGDAEFDGAVTIGGDVTIGNSSDATRYISINKAASGENGILFKNAGSNKIKIIQDSAENLRFYTNNTSLRMSLMEGGNLGIGTNDPNHAVDIYSDSNIPLRIHRPNSALDSTEPVGIGFSMRGDANKSTTDTRAGIFSQYNGDFYISVDAGGNIVSNPISEVALFIEGSNKSVLIGKTAEGTSNNGVELRQSGYIFGTTDGTVVARFNRRTSSGDVVEIRKDNSNVGSIGIEGGDSLYIQSTGSTGSGLRFHPSTPNILPVRNGATIDDVVSLGSDTRRFKELYLSGILDSDGILKTSASTASGVIINNTSGAGAGIRFSDQTIDGTGQQGYLKFFHINGSSYGQGAAFVASSTENLAFVVDGQLQFSTLAIKASSGTGAGTEIMDSNAQFTNIKKLTFTSANTNVEGIYLSNSHRIYGNGARALEVNGTNLQFGEGLTGAINIQADAGLQMNGVATIDASRNAEFNDVTVDGDIVMSGSNNFLVIENSTENNAGIVFNDLQAGAWPAASSQRFIMQYDSGGESGVGSMIMGHDDDSYIGFYFQKGGSLECKGNVIAYGSTSDIRLKDNVEVIPNALEKVMALRGVTFNYKKDGSRSTGLIAQELKEVLPEVVYETNDVDTGEEYYAVRYGNTAGLLVEAVKELKRENDELREMVKTLMEKINGND